MVQRPIAAEALAAKKYSGSSGPRAAAVTCNEGTMANGAGIRALFWIESILAILATGLMLLTLVSREWIEWLTGTDPDGGNGTLEWVIVAACAAVAMAAGFLARREWSRTRQRA